MDAGSRKKMFIDIKNRLTEEGRYISENGYASCKFLLGDGGHWTLSVARIGPRGGLKFIEIHAEPSTGSLLLCGLREGIYRETVYYKGGFSCSAYYEVRNGNQICLSEDYEF